MRLRLLPFVLSLAVLAGCGGEDSDADAEPAKASITVWILENEPDRLKATTSNVADFTRRTGIRVRIVGVGDDDFAERFERARSDGSLPDVAQLPLPSVHAYAREGILDTQAAEDVVERLGDETFSQTALTLVSREGRLAGVPSDGWGQLLIYRKDLFERAGLRPPETLADVRRAARRLHRGSRAGIALPTTPEDGFTAETFEHVALAAGCQITDDGGEVDLDSRACRRAFRYYADLARTASLGAGQDVDSTRAAYFSGDAAMLFWSPFLLDAMAGLRDDVAPTCPQCREDPRFLARNSGLVGALSSEDAAPAQFGEIATWGITTAGDVGAAERFVEYMLSDGYLRWLALSPQGKFPVRAGDAQEPERFFEGWEELESGVDRTARLRDVYPDAAIDALGESVRNFRRWGFAQGQAPLVGALRNSQPVTRALAAAVDGSLEPDAAAAQAQRDVSELQASLE